ncbi:phosphoribosyltransferase family protein [Dactylosporangium sp. NPDC049742]|uniref:phosphoribosyltransferase family protein n=1 Tax=Dactylosporangium sp. NPDC049742 TaxID=3154737 RepID=UPI003436E3A3
MVDLVGRLQVGFHWRRAPYSDVAWADVTEWWRDPVVLRDLPAAVAGLVPGAPTLVAGPVSRGSLLGALVAAHLGVGLVEVRKNDRAASGPDPGFVRRALPGSYHGGGGVMSFRRGLVRPGDRVLCVDDWVESGTQAEATRDMVLEVGADFVGTACVVDDIADTPEGDALRTALGLRALLRAHDL